MARRGGTDYNKWASFDDEDDDPLAKLTVSTERRHPPLPKVVRKRPEAPRPASKGRKKAPTEPAALPKELPTVKDVAPELAPLKAKRLRKAIDAMGAADRFDVSIFPMQAFMHFKRGEEAHDRRAAYDEISRAHGTKVDDVWAQLQEVYDEEGLTLTRDGKVGNPFDAQRLLWFAEKSGKALDVLDALLEACHAKGQPLSDLAVLNDCAFKAGLAKSARDDDMARFLVSPRGGSDVALQLGECLDRGVVASPVVVLDRRFPLEGAHPYAVVGAVLAELLATGTNFRVVAPSGMDSSKWP